MKKELYRLWAFVSRNCVSSTPPDIPESVEAPRTRKPLGSLAQVKQDDGRPHVLRGWVESIKELEPRGFQHIVKLVLSVT